MSGRTPLAALRLACCVLAVHVTAIADSTVDLEQLKNSVVRIFDAAKPESTIGGGIVIGSDSTRVYVLTCFHVVGDAKSLQVQFYRHPAAKYIVNTEKADDSLDIAVISVSPADSPLPSGLMRLSLARFSAGTVGMQATSIGFPFGREWHPAINPVLTPDSLNDLRKFTMQKASIDRGNSGGPVFTPAGELLGMVTNLGQLEAVAVKMEEALRVVDELWRLPVNSISRGAAENLPEGKSLFRAKKYSEALPLLTDDAQGGDARAAAMLGAMYERGLGVASDAGKAVTYYKQAADADDAMGLGGLGEAYFSGLGGAAPNYTTALSLLQKAAARDDMRALFRLGYMNQQGIGVPVNNAKARELYEQAVAAGSGGAADNLGTMIEDGTGGSPPDFDLARQWYEKGAALDSRSAAYDFARMLQFGRGGPKDLPKAYTFYQKAASQGYGLAMRRLGNWFRDGTYVPKDPEQAKQWYQKAEATNDPGVLFLLAEDHKENYPSFYTDTERDIRRRYLEMAASGGNKEAQLALVSEYNALQWLEPTANSGNAQAMYRLGMAYFDKGRATESYPLARKWLTEAAAAGDATAKKVLQWTPSKLFFRCYNCKAYYMGGAERGSGTLEINDLGVSWVSNSTSRLKLIEPEVDEREITRLRCSDLNPVVLERDRKKTSKKYSLLIQHTVRLEFECEGIVDAIAQVCPSVQVVTPRN
jgi:TPR repeat protein